MSTVDDKDFNQRNDFPVGALASFLGGVIAFAKQQIFPPPPGTPNDSVLISDDTQLAKMRWAASSGGWRGQHAENHYVLHRGTDELRRHHGRKRHDYY